MNQIINLSVFTFFITFLIALANAQQQFPWTVGQVSNFHTRGNFRDVIKNVSVYFEEYYSYKTHKGRFVMNIMGSEVTFVYGKDTNQLTFVLKNKTTTLCKVVNNLSTSKVSDVINKLPVVNILSSYFVNWWIDIAADQKTDYLMLGPTALLRKMAKNRDNLKWTVTGTGQMVRGISATKQTMQGTGRIFDVSTIIDCYFTDPKWQRPGNIANTVPLRFTIKNNLDIEYFVFEGFQRIYGEFLPPTGIGCVGKKTPPSIELPEIAESFSATIEKYDIFKYEKRPIIKKHYIVYDDFLGLVLIQGDEADPQSKLRAKVIQDFEWGIEYVQDDQGTCSINHLRQASSVNPQGMMKNSSSYLLHGKDMYYMGKNYARGVLCQVWERVLFNSSIPYSYDSYGSPDAYITYDKVVITFYILDSDSQEIVDDGDETFDVPIKTVVTGYTKQDPKHVSYKIEYNYFSYDDRSMNLYDDYIDVFNVQNCFPRYNQRLYLNLVINSTSKNRIQIAGQDYNEFRHELAGVIAETADISPIRVPLIDIDAGQTSIMANVLILGRLPYSLAFGIWREGMRMNYEIEIKNWNMNLDNCAQGALAKGKKYFFWCTEVKPPRCFISNSSNTNPNQKSKYTNQVGFCDLYSRDAVLKNDFNLTKSPNLTQITDRLMKASLKNQFKFSIETTPGKYVNYSVIQVMASQNVTSDLTGNTLYYLAVSGGSIDENAATTVIQTSSDDNPLLSIGDCFDRCKNSMTINCLTFTFCSNYGQDIKCYLTSKRIDMKQTGIKRNTLCNTYSMAYLNAFKRINGQIIGGSGDKSLSTTTANLCAKECISNSDMDCRGFEFCQNGMCYLRQSHTIDINPNQKPAPGDVKCVFYSRKFLSDFKDAGHTLIKDDNSEKIRSLAAEDCARLCRQKYDNCVSFNFCPQTSSEDTLCELSTKSLNNGRPKTYTKANCRHYEMVTKKYIFGLSTGSFYGLIFGLFVVGMTLGAVGYFGYNYYKERSQTPSSDQSDGQNKSRFNIRVKFIRNSKGDREVLHNEE